MGVKITGKGKNDPAPLVSSGDYRYFKKGL